MTVKYSVFCRTWSAPIMNWWRKIWTRLFLFQMMMKRRIYQSTSLPSMQRRTSRAPARTRMSEDLWSSRCCSTTTRGTSWWERRRLDRLTSNFKFHLINLASSCRRRPLWQSGSQFWGSWGICQSPSTTQPSTTEVKRSQSWPRSMRRWERRPTRESCRRCRQTERWGGRSAWLNIRTKAVGKVFLSLEGPFRVEWAWLPV